MALAETEGMYFSGPDIRYGTNYNQSTGQTADAFLAAYNAEWGEDPAAPFWAHSMTRRRFCSTRSLLRL
ncbi:MAG: hypothetical protein Ct9H300mP12_08730 [Acidimicrobiales bacterium]|nr:MAG: hypothetical protein Ct9H300mP12_08730 [Acidimicrobiales bacterium]